MTTLNAQTLHHGEGSPPPLQKAHLGLRIGAFLIDHIIFVTILVVPILSQQLRNAQRTPLLFPALLSATFVLYTLKDIVRGRSIGKRALGLVVRRSTDSAEMPSIVRLIVRNLLTLLWPIEFMVLICGRKKAKLGDTLAGTDVYRLPQRANVALILFIATWALLLSTVAVIFGIFSFIKNDDSYQAALRFIESNPQIVEKVGAIEGYGFLPSGSLSYSGPYGHAYYTIKVVGSKGKLRIGVELEKKPGKDWRLLDFGIEE